MGKISFFRCVTCGKKYEPNTLHGICKACGSTVERNITMFKGLLEPLYNYQALRNKVTTSVIEKRKGLSSIVELLPVSERFLVSLGEGDTPLVRCDKLSRELGLKNLYTKCEGSNPTGCFKDRETAVAVSKALELGFSTVACVSSGNAASSLAAYSAKTGLNCFIFMPSTTSPAKITQTSIHGANVILVDGIYEQALEFSNKVLPSTKIYNCSPSINPVRTEGDKSTAVEICRDLKWTPPDWVFVPVGNGSHLSGLWKGFWELYELGMINSLPKMAGIGVQAGAPLVEAYRKGFSEFHVVDCKESVAEGVVAAWSYDAPKVVKAIKESSGILEAVSDENVLSTLRLLAKREGIFAGPSGVVAMAGLMKLVETDVIDKSETVVVILTETGLKDTRPIADDWKSAVVHVKPTREAAEKIVKPLLQ